MKKTIFSNSVILTILCILSIAGCTTIPRKVVVEEKKPRTDIELRHKLEEWATQLYSDDPTIRSSAAVSLLGLHLLNAQKPLIDVLKDQKAREDVKISVINAFGFTRDDRATRYLIKLLDSESMAIQTAAMDALGRIKTKESIRMMANSMLNPEESRNVKMLLAKALGNTNHREAVESLIKMLTTEDRELRNVAMKSLEKITKLTSNNDSSWWKEWWLRNKSKTREQWLEEIVLKQEENTLRLEEQIKQLRQDVAQKTIKLIELRSDKNDLKLLADAIKSDYPEVRIFVAKELAKIKKPSSIDILINAITDSEEEVRIEVVQALGEIGDKNAIRPLINALNDESLEVRKKAAEALGQLENSAAVNTLILALNNEKDTSMVCAIIEALGQIGDLKAVKPLIAFLKHKEPKIRECTAASLGKLSDTRAVEPLIVALDDEEERVRWYAADSLGKIGNPESVDSLIQHLTDNSARVRESVVTALGQIRNKKAIESLLKALQDTDKRVAEQAAEHLVNIKDANLDIMESIATTFYANKDYKRAEVVLDRLIKKYSEHPELKEKTAQMRIKLAQTLFALKDWQKASNLYEEISRRYPNNDTVKKELIQCLKELKQFDRALEWFSEWLEEKSQNYQLCWQGRFDIAYSMFEQGKYEQVRDLIQTFKTEDPDLGGDELKSRFQTLKELCKENSASSRG